MTKSDKRALGVITAVTLVFFIYITVSINVTNHTIEQTENYRVIP